MRITNLPSVGGGSGGGGIVGGAKFSPATGFVSDGTGTINLDYTGGTVLTIGTDGAQTVGAPAWADIHDFGGISYPALLSNGIYLVDVVASLSGNLPINATVAGFGGLTGEFVSGNLFWTKAVIDSTAGGSSGSDISVIQTQYVHGGTPQAMGPLELLFDGTDISNVHATVNFVIWKLS